MIHFFWHEKVRLSRHHQWRLLAKNEALLPFYTLRREQGVWRVSQKARLACVTSQRAHSENYVSLHNFWKIVHALDANERIFLILWCVKSCGLTFFPHIYDSWLRTMRGPRSTVNSAATAAHHELLQVLNAGEITETLAGWADLILALCGIKCFGTDCWHSTRSLLRASSSASLSFLGLSLNPCSCRARCRVLFYKILFIFWREVLFWSLYFFLSQTVCLSAQLCSKLARTLRIQPSLQLPRLRMWK